MTTPALVNWQIELVGVLLGEDTPYLLTALDLPKPDTRSQDAVLPSEDGVRFGQDWLAGMTVTLEMDVDGDGAEGVLANVAALRRVWLGTVRGTAGSVVPLRIRRPGRPAMRLYGRPRRFGEAGWSNVGVGYVPVVADFACSDHRLYSDIESSLSISGDPIAYTGTAGTTTPHVPPVTLAEATLPSDVATNNGDSDTWPVITFHGPREQPGLSYVNESRGVWLAMVLGDGRSVTVDTRPWHRSVIRDDGASLAGMLRGSRLSDLAFSPGDTQLAFDGRDSTLTSSVEVKWRDAFSSL